MPVTLTSVTTTDATPTVAPHKISAQSGENAATVAFDVDGSGGGGRIGAVRVRFNASAVRTTGRVMWELGAVCGLSRCGVGRPLDVAAPHSFAAGIDYAHTGAPADGDYAVWIDGMVNAAWE